MKFLRVLLQMATEVTAGNYINLALCKFYNDNSYEEWIVLLMQALENFGAQSVRQLKKVNEAAIYFIVELFRKNAEMMVCILSPDTINYLLKEFLLPNLFSECREHQSKSILALD